MVGTRHGFWFSALLALAAALLAGSLLPGAASFEERGGELVAPLSSAVADATRPLADALQHGGQLHELSEENASLRQELARLEAELAALRESEIAAGQLADLIAAAGAEDAGRYLAATVVLRDPAPGRDVIVIDRGERDGLRVGQPVLGPGATLVGMVSSLQDRRARVRLLTDPDSALAAIVQSTRTQAALAGGPDGLRLEFAPLEDAITVGDLVLTSALGGRLPGGLLAGRITHVDRTGQDLFATVHVEPLANYSRLERVLVLTEAPASAGAAPRSGE